MKATLGISLLNTDLVMSSVIAQLVKNPSAMQETWVWFLGREDPLEKGKATHSSIVVWRIPWTVYYMGLQRVRYDRMAFTFTIHPHPTQVLNKELCSWNQINATFKYTFTTSPSNPTTTYLAYRKLMFMQWMFFQARVLEWGATAFSVMK